MANHLKAIKIKKKKEKENRVTTNFHNQNSEKRVTTNSPTKSDNYLPKGKMKIVQLIPLDCGGASFRFWITPHPPQLPFIVKRDQSVNKTSTMGY